MDSWHQPWYLRKRSSQSATTRETKADSKNSRHRKRRALSVTRTSNTQPQCTFLSRVPGEIRNAIYLLLLGNRRLCIHQDGPNNRLRLSHEGWTDVQTMLSDNPPYPTNKLAILQTCQQIYVEAADILYTTNCFQMPDMDYIKAFNLFTRTISPTRLASITSLSLICEIDYFEPLHPYASTMFKHWKRMWATICLDMSALRHLTLQLQLLWIIKSLKLTANTYWVKPILQLRNLETFELIVEHDDIVAPEGFAHLQRPGDVEPLTARAEWLKQYSKKLLCSPR